MHDDLTIEHQLRRYADHVEELVAVAPPARTRGRWFFYAAVAAVAVVLAGLVVQAGSDDPLPTVDQPEIVVPDPPITTTTVPPTTTVPATTTGAPTTTVSPTTSLSIPASGTVSPVPAVTQLFADTALMQLRTAGFEPIIIFEAVDPDGPLLGRVLAQDPEPGALIEPGSTVSISVGEAAAEVSTTTTVASGG